VRPRTRYQWERAIRCMEILPPARKLVALVLATYANNDGTNARPGEGRLAQNCGISERAVRGHLAALRDLGLIVRTFQGSSAGRQKLADSYDLNMPSDSTRAPEAPFR
jgi:predicted ArsR family transcriptional regulator